MVWRSLRKGVVIPLLLILAAIGYWRLYPHAPKVISVGYLADRDAILWNTLAQVKQPVGELHYGDRVEVIGAEGTSVRLRAPSGTTGWLLDSRKMMDEQIWGGRVFLLALAQTLALHAPRHL